MKDTAGAWAPSKIDPVGQDIFDVGVGEISTASTSPGSTQWSSRTLENRLGVSGEDESEDAAVYGKKSRIDDDTDNDENQLPESMRGQK